MLKQRTSDEIESIAIFGQDVATTFLSLAKDALDLFVDDTGCVIGIVASVHEVLAEKDLSL